jgi:hypothetical protein
VSGQSTDTVVLPERAQDLPTVCMKCAMLIEGILFHDSSAGMIVGAGIFVSTGQAANQYAG